MPSQVVYQTNADFIASQEAMVKRIDIKADVSQKGLLTFWFRGSQTVFVLAPTGKLQVKWSSLQEKTIYFRFLKDVLIAYEKEELVIKPLRQQTWIEYPVPKSFKLFWCDQATEHILKKPDTDKQESENEPFVLKLESVSLAVEGLRHELRFLREPTVKEVAEKLGCIISKYLKDFLLQANWKNESKEDIKKIAEQAINLAGWLNFKEKGESNPQLIALSQRAIDSAPMKAMNRAQLILKNCPDIVPKVHLNELKWSFETKTMWIQVFGNKPPPPQTWN